MRTTDPSLSLRRPEPVALSMPRRAAAGLLMIVLVVAGCGDPQQVLQSNPVGVNGASGDILLRAVRIAAPDGPRYPPGAQAPVWLTLLNEGPRPDALVAVSSPVARSVQIRWDRDCDGTPQVVDVLPLPGEPPQTPPSTGAPPFDSYSLRLVDLTEEVLAGASVPVVFTFRHAPPITLDVPVRPSERQDRPGSTCVA